MDTMYSLVPRPSPFCSLVCVQYNTWMCKSSRKTGKAWERSYEIYRKGVCYNYVGGTYIVHVELEIGVPAASFRGSRVWAEKKKPGTDCLHILSSPTISGFLEIWKFPYNMLCYTNFHDASRLLPCEKFLPMTMLLWMMKER